MLNEQNGRSRTRTGLPASSRAANKPGASANGAVNDISLAWPPDAHAHIGYVTRDEYEIQFADIFDQIVAYAAGAPINVVNPEAMTSELER